MHRLGSAPTLALSCVLLLGLAACDGGEPTTPPEPDATAQADAAPPAEPEPELEPEVEAEPEPEPEPAPAAERDYKEGTISKDGFEARALDCKLNDAVEGARGFTIAGLSKQDAAFDACAPKGAVVDVEWNFVSNASTDISISAESGKVASCVGAAFAKVRAGVGSGKCSVTLLIGDATAAAAAYDAR